MKRIIGIFSLFLILTIFIPFFSFAQDSIPSVINDVSQDFSNSTVDIHQTIKIKFLEGSAFFMSIIAICLIVGLVFCLERIIYLNLAQINTRKFLSEIENDLKQNNMAEAKDLAQNSRGPVASICYQAISQIDEDLDVIDRSVTMNRNVQIGLLERNLSWITLFIAIAPSLGFLGTVIGMIQAFDNVQQFGDINPTVVAGGMKFALITTVGGLIVAIILQVFYNYILTKIEEIVNDMENNSIRILDLIIQYKNRAKKNENQSR